MNLVSRDEVEWRRKRRRIFGKAKYFLWMRRKRRKIFREGKCFFVEEKNRKGKVGKCFEKGSIWPEEEKKIREGKGGKYLEKICQGC